MIASLCKGALTLNHGWIVVEDGAAEPGRESTGNFGLRNRPIVSSEEAAQHGALILQKVYINLLPQQDLPELLSA